ncbi:MULTISPECIES: hypothetical protein [unclassified Pseudomonas]|uniref:hypothetical protein n=1 Tax=unclassified Pseudomonas TaxID=196821 RepID=UPI00224B260B|nr:MULTISPECIES: hypothetical protein [unclassified Pseudomonas]MCX2814949.1 hypothetical protein [Pseudomonas sp. DCB_E]MCX9144169.1 hypothetical protein [Pseudomonas sp. DCB_Q]
MDKILLTAFLTALAGLITAALSIVKLVNDKESKITEFRQLWTESARLAMADLIAKINSHVVALVNFKAAESNLSRDVKRMNSVTDPVEKEYLKGTVDFQYEFLRKSFDISQGLLNEVHLAHAKVRLHFKPEDTEFVRVENKIEQYFSKADEIRRSDSSEDRNIFKEQVHAAMNEVAASSRALLKNEWEKIKLGEPAYKQTKKWSVRMCGGMLLVLITIGVHAISSFEVVETKKNDSAGPAHTGSNPKE